MKVHNAALDLKSAPSPVGAKRILLIDDDIELSAMVECILTAAGYSVSSVTSGQAGLHQFHIFRPDLLIVDVSMPGMSGIDFFKHFRRISGVPVIFLSAFDDEKTILEGLDCGAVDYVTKPFRPRIFLARVKLALRVGSLMSGVAANATYDDGHLEIDRVARRVCVDGEPIRLTSTEFALLQYLTERAGIVCSIEELLAHVWDDHHRDAVGHIYTYVRRLRTKLERDPKMPEYIISEHGKGYRFRSRQPVARMYAPV